MYTWLSLGLALAIFAGCAQTMPPRRHPELGVRRERVKRVALLPPEVAMGAPPYAARRLVEATLLQLERLGFEAVYLAAASDGELQTLADSAHATLAEVFAARTPIAETQAAYFRRSFGPGASALAAAAATDGLVLVRLQSDQRTAALESSNPLVAARERGHALFRSGPAPSIYIPPPMISSSSGPPLSVAVLQVALVDGGDGELLWANETRETGRGVFGPSVGNFISVSGDSIDGLVMTAWRPFAGTPADDAVNLAVPIELLGQERFTCCNLTFDGDGEASDANYGLCDYADRIVLPAGTRVRVTEAKKNEIRLEEVGSGRRLTMALEYGRDWIGAVAYFRLLFPAAAPAEISERPREIVAAMRDGMIAHGMTKAEVLGARGYPPFHQTPGIEANDWVYYDAPGAGQFVFFTDGYVSAIRVGEAP